MNVSAQTTTLDSARVVLKDLIERVDGIVKVQQPDQLEQRFQELGVLLEDPELWNDQVRAAAISRDRGRVERILGLVRGLVSQSSEFGDYIDMCEDEGDPTAISDAVKELSVLRQKVDDAELQSLFTDAIDVNDAWIEIQAGSGGTEAQDWAEHLLRMYLRYCERRGYDTQLTDRVPGEVAGIKRAVIQVTGDYAYGWLKTESGVHRLVRRSPFDSSNRRHTSFASVFVTPFIDDTIEVDIDMSDVRVDTYRASGAGGQHVNKTDSAVRMTHLPTGVVVQCQSERSQHQNRDRCMAQLRARLHQLELAKQRAVKDAMEAEKPDIGWGQQIRNYVLDQSRIKDLRTDEQRNDCTQVLDGDIDGFIKATLRHQATR